MKKNLLALTLAALLLLSACAAPGEATQPQAASAVLGEPEKGYPYSNMQKNVPSGNFIHRDGEVLFTHYDGDFRLYSYSMATGEVTTYCTDATCRHLSGSCPGSIISNLEVYDGIVYGLNQSGRICKEQDGAFLPMDIDGTLSGFFHAGGDLFLRSPDGALLLCADGTQAPEVLVPEHPGYYEVVLGDYLYYGDVGDTVCRRTLYDDAQTAQVLLKGVVHLTDGHHIYYCPVGAWELYRCDMDGTNSVLLLDKPVMVSRAGFDEEYFYYTLYNDFTNSKREDGADVVELFRFRKDDPTNHEFLAELPVTDAAIYTIPGEELLFLECQLRRDGMETVQSLYTIHRNGSDLTKLELPKT